MCFLKPIFTSLSPNIENDDIELAFRLVFSPWKWKKGEAVKKLENEFKRYLKSNYVFAFNSGRSALMAVLYSLGISKGDEVLLQAFTCNAAVNPILAIKANPVFVDIDKTININTDDLKKKITSRTKAIIVQHTFGYPAEMEKILKIAKENNLFLIEDCAHSLGAEYHNKKIGTFGDAAFFSFGRDKVISSVFGGMAVSNNKKIGKALEEFQKKLDFPSEMWIFQQILHPLLVNYFILPAYGFHYNLGRIILGIFHKLSILSKAVYKKEKLGKIPKYFPKKMPNALAVLALNQFGKLERFNKHRREIAGFYKENLKEKFEMPFLDFETNKEILPVFMRFPILANENTDRILIEARRRKIYLNDGWRKSPIVPENTDLTRMKYQLGSCPRAEEIVERVINLPTHINISKKQAQKIIRFLKK